MKRRVALITGIRGQDGAYLARFLLEKGYIVYGADRRSGASSNWRLEELGIIDKVKIIYMDLLEYSNIFRVIRDVRPDEVYNLAAQSFVQTSFEQPLLTANVNALGVLRLLETIRTLIPECKFYQASTSEMFGRVQESPQTENTPFYPRSPYGISKLFAHWTAVNYREAYGIFACSGILFNHESPLRGAEFVTRKISLGVASIKLGLRDKLVLGNLDAKRDWGYAPEYVEGMWLMLQQARPDDYVLATGQTHSVKDFVVKAFEVVGIEIEWEGKAETTRGIDKSSGRVLVEVSSEYYRPAEVDVLCGKAEKARKILGWRPKTKFDRLVEIMVEADLARLKRKLVR